MLTTNTVAEIESFRLLKVEWQELLQDSESDCVFLTWEWLYTWWQHLAEDRSLLIILVRSGGRLIGIAPFALRPSRWQRLLPFPAIEFLGCANVGSDYLDLILRKGFESEALTAIAAELEQRQLTLQLSNLSAGKTAIRELIFGLLQRGWQHTSVPVDKCPYVDLRNKQWDSYSASLGKSHHRRLHNLNKNFRVNMRRVEHAAECRTVLDTMIDFHLKRLADQGGSDGFHTSELVSFHHAFTQLALQRGWLRLFVLELDDNPAACFYCMNYRDKYYYYQSGLDMQFKIYSVGLAGIALIIKAAIAEGASEFDFLHGAESYKYLWAKEDRVIVRFDVFAPHPGGRLCRKSMGVRTFLMRHLRPGNRKDMSHIAQSSA
jgi:CelD/BcsL family acetyltransferase involved in cellulose biosynthesis